MIVVCGEALMDVFPAGDTATGVALDARVGGSPFNVAIGLARLEQAVSFLGAISTDFLGERLVHALRAEGVDTALVVRVDAPTTLGLVGANLAGVPSYTFHGVARTGSSSPTRSRGPSRTPRSTWDRSRPSSSRWRGRSARSSSATSGTCS